MKLWEVTNGYIGESYVKCFVIAETEPRALELAQAKYRADNGHGDHYWQELEAECICEDTGREWATKPRDH